MKNKKIIQIFTALIFLFFLIAASQPLAESAKIHAPQYGISAQLDTPFLADEETPLISPAMTGQIIAYIDPTGNISLYDLSTKVSQKITSDATLENFFSSYSRLLISPDGRYLAASDGDQGYLFDLEGGKQVFKGDFYPLGWLADSRSFYAGPGGEVCTQDEIGPVVSEIYSISISGNIVQTGASAQYFNSRTALSPDGQWISAPQAMCFSDAGSNSSYSFSEDKLYRTDSVDVFSVDFFPDSKMMVFSSGNCILEETYETRLYLSDPRFQSISELAREEGMILSEPRLSYDGKYLAYSAVPWSEDGFFDPNQKGIRIMDLNSKDVFQIPGDSNQFLAWSPHSLQFLYADLQLGKTYLHSVSSSKSSETGFEICISQFCSKEASW